MNDRVLNRTLLERQLLLERSGDPIPRVLERMGGLQAQNATSMYIGLWTRMRDLERGALTRALEAREVVVATLMRGTIHLVSREDYWPIAQVTEGINGPIWQRQNAGLDMADAVTRLRAALRDGPLTRAQVAGVVGEERARGVHLFTNLLRVPPSSTWERRRANIYADPEAELGPPDDRDGIELLVRRYLGGFGPAAPADVANWIGIGVERVRERMAAMDLQELPGGLLDLPGATLADPDTPAPVRLLPTWDAVLLVHCRRAGILPEDHRRSVFATTIPHSVITVLVDGAVRGAWHPREGLQWFERVDARWEREARAEAERLQAWIS